MARKTEHELTIETFTQQQELNDLRDLVRWVGKEIASRNANGKLTNKFCLFCSHVSKKRLACRHAEVWAYNKEGQ